MATIHRNGQVMTDADTWREGVACYRESESVPDDFRTPSNMTSERGDEFWDLINRAMREKESER